MSSGVPDLMQYLFWMCFGAVAHAACLLDAGVFAAFDTIGHKVLSGHWCALAHTEYHEHGHVPSLIAEAFAIELM